MIGLYVLLCFISFDIVADMFSHARAVTASNQGDYAKAQTLLDTVLVEHPHDPVTLYDAGIAAFRIGNHAHAATYFDAAAHKAGDNKELAERAWSNAGNAYAHTQDYDKAVEAYEAALKINRENERTQHNYEVVKKLREQQQDKEQQQQNNEEQKQDQEQQKNNDQQDQDQEQDSENSDDAQNDEQQQSEGSKDNSDGGDQEDQKSDQKNEKGTRDTNKNQSSQRDEKQGKNGSPQNSTANPRAHEDAHNAMSKEKNVQRGSSDGQSAVSGQRREEAIPELAGDDKAWMRALLEKCEEHDTENNKEFLRSTLDAQGECNARPTW
jgi:Ca-activated chloride channel family protein